MSQALPTQYVQAGRGTPTKPVLLGALSHWVVAPPTSRKPGPQGSALMLLPPTPDTRPSPSPWVLSPEHLWDSIHFSASTTSHLDTAKASQLMSLHLLAWLKNTLLLAVQVPFQNLSHPCWESYNSSSRWALG